MDHCWRIYCDIIVEEYRIGTNVKQAEWKIKQGKILLEDREDARSATLYVPRHGVSIPVKLLGGDFSLHANFLSEGKCSIRIRRPVNVAIFMSGIAHNHLQATLHFLNAMVASRTGKPNGLTSTTLTGDSDHHPDNRDDLHRRALRNKPIQSEGLHLEKENRPSQANHSSTLSADSSQPLKPRTNTSSPKRFLSPRGVRFLQLSQTARQRVLAANPAFQAHRQAQLHQDPSWSKREQAFADALNDTQISLEQRQVLVEVFQGHSVFFTGSAGTGKSFLIHKLLSSLPGIGVSTHITSTTGITAMAIQGLTIYAWAGLGSISGRETSQELAQRVRRSRDTHMRWIQTRTLLIDEVSMLDGNVLQTLHEVAQTVRGNQLPFGGIQLILAGDFFQLPPVTPRGEIKFAFEAPCWSLIITKAIELSTVYRQKAFEFVSMLDEIRRGHCSTDTAERLRECQSRTSATETSHGIKPTALLTLKSQVDLLNARELEALPGQAHVFYAKDLGVGSHLESLSNNCPARSRLELKVGAQVILLKNLSVSDGLCNGSRGVVVRFATQTRHPIVQFLTGAEHVITPVNWSVTIGGKVMASREAIPLDLAYAISIHKSQGMSLDRASINLSHVFEYGQAYVALSRVRSLEGLQLIGLIDTNRQIKAHPRVKLFYDQLERQRSEHQTHRQQSRILSPKATRPRIEPINSTDEKPKHAGLKRKADSDSPSVDELPPSTITRPPTRLIFEPSHDKQRCDEMGQANSQVPSPSIPITSSDATNKNIVEVNAMHGDHALEPPPVALVSIDCPPISSTAVLPPITALSFFRSPLPPP